MSLRHLDEALRFFRRARRVKKEGFRRYRGSPEEICRRIIDDAYEPAKGYFRVSSGHFCVFYVRDFVFNCKALKDLGYAREVERTFRYALERFSNAGRITTTISQDGTPFDFPEYTPESLALLLLGLRKTGNAGLAREFKEFLQSQLDVAAKEAIDAQTLLPRKDKAFQSLRDQVRLEGACYIAVMLAVIARESEALGLRFPHGWKDIRKSVIESYWNGSYFFNDLTRQHLVIADANVFPFWTGIVDDPRMKRSVIGAIENAGLDRPFPLKYISTKDKGNERKRIHIGSLFSKDYMTDTLWMHLGLAYLEVLADVDPERTKKHLRAYTRNIKRHGTFLELYWPDGKPYQTPFYVTDEAMVWCATYLALARKLAAKQMR